MPTPIDVWWLLIASALVALILGSGVMAAIVVQQRRYLAATRAFSGRVIMAHEEERAFVARELHDGLIQRVVLLGGELARLPDGPNPDPGELARWQAAFREELSDFAEDIRRIAHRMHPSVLDTIGFDAALESLVDEVSTTSGLQVLLFIEATPAPLTPDAALCLYRVAQEGIRNVVRHAQASSATLRVHGARGGVRLELTDDGVGWTSAHRDRGTGLGLRSLAERVRLLGGEFAVRTAPGRGTTITAWVPVR